MFDICAGGNLNSLVLMESLAAVGTAIYAYFYIYIHLRLKHTVMGTHHMSRLSVTVN